MVDGELCDGLCGVAGGAGAAVPAGEAVRREEEPPDDEAAEVPLEEGWCGGGGLDGS